jgi:hypothetical protein
MWSKRRESAIEVAVDRPVDHPPTRDGLLVKLAVAPSQNLSRSLRGVLAAARSPLSTRALASMTAVLKLERFIVDGRATSAANPAGVGWAPPLTHSGAGGQGDRLANRHRDAPRGRDADRRSARGAAGATGAPRAGRTSTCAGAGCLSPATAERSFVIALNNFGAIALDAPWIASQSKLWSSIVVSERRAYAKPPLPCVGVRTGFACASGCYAT